MKIPCPRYQSQQLPPTEHCNNHSGVMVKPVTGWSVIGRPPRNNHSGVMVKPADAMDEIPGFIHLELVFIPVVLGG
jgi:hypothetical protein